jgi:L-ascorbate metabolism protein UlaG (beta-lactamase superfamily)
MILLECGSFRLLPDPVFDLPGKKYSFGFGTSSLKTSMPVQTPLTLGKIDAVLLSHD